MVSEQRLNAAIVVSNLIPAEDGLFEWVSAETHAAPVRFLPIDEAIRKKTNAGLLTVMAGCLILCAKRLASCTDTKLCYRMAEAIICYQADYSVKKRLSDFPEPVISPAPANAVYSVTRAAGKLFFTTARSHSKFPPNAHFKNVVFMTKHILGAENRTGFRDWLEFSLARLDLLAACPNQDRLPKSEYDTEEAWVASRRKNFGTPVPIEVLRPTEPPRAEELEALYSDFLSEVDYTSHPFLLRAPE